MNLLGEHHRFASGRQWTSTLPGFEEFSLKGGDPLLGKAEVGAGAFKA
ncbi:hypothetical protein ACIP68_36790 [Streptomyces griseoviridis]